MPAARRELRCRSVLVDPRSRSHGKKRSRRPARKGVCDCVAALRGKVRHDVAFPRHDLDRGREVGDLPTSARLIRESSRGEFATCRGPQRPNVQSRLRRLLPELHASDRSVLDGGESGAQLHCSIVRVGHEPRWSRAAPDRDSSFAGRSPRRPHNDRYNRRNYGDYAENHRAPRSGRECPSVQVSKNIH